MVLNRVGILVRIVGLRLLMGGRSNGPKCLVLSLTRASIR